MRRDIRTARYRHQERSSSLLRNRRASLRAELGARPVGVEVRDRQVPGLSLGGGVGGEILVSRSAAVHFAAHAGAGHFDGGDAGVAIKLYRNSESSLAQTR